jgi:hypothetical protein
MYEYIVNMKNNTTVTGTQKGIGTGSPAAYECMPDK